MEKYIKSGLKREDDTDIMCLSYEYYLRHKDEFLSPLEKKKINYIRRTELTLKESTEDYKSIDNKHDKLFKELLSNNTEAINFINNYLHLKEKIEANDIEIYKTNYITRTYRSKDADIVYKMKNKNIFFLIEHQSTVDRSMPYRIANYVMAIINQAVEKDRKKIRRKNYKFPKVIPMVLYTGKERWKAEVKLSNIQEELNGYKEKEEDYILIDVNDYSIEELLKDNSVISKAMIMEKSRAKEETIKNLGLIANEVYEQKLELGEYLLEVMQTFILKDDLAKEANEVIEKIREKKGGKKEMLAVVKMIEEENKSYIRQGRIEGRKEGKTEAKMEIAKNLIQMGMKEEQIAKVTGLKIEEIKRLK